MGKKQIDYWLITAEEVLNIAELLLSNQRILHVLFFCHLCIEKIIKAHVAKRTNELPLKIHNLSYLLEKTDLILDQDQQILTDTLMYYQLEGRYPQYYPRIPSKEKSLLILENTKNYLYV